MTVSIPKNTLIVVADGEHAILFRNTSDSGIKIENIGHISHKHGETAARTPHETAPNEQDDASFARHIANDLYSRAHKGEFEKLVLIADPQTLGQIRPNLHSEVSKRVVLELHKTLVKSTVQDIEKHLKDAA